MARIIERSVVLADSGGFRRWDQTPVSRSASSQTLSLFVAVKHSVFGKRIPHDVDVLVTRSLSLSLALSLTLSDFRQRYIPAGKPPSQQKYCSHRNVLTDFLLGHLRPGEQPADNPCAAWQELRFILLMSLAIFSGSLLRFLFPAPLSAGQGQKVTGSIAHNLLNKTLQLLTIKKLNEPR